MFRFFEFYLCTYLDANEFSFFVWPKPRRRYVLVFLNLTRAQCSVGKEGKRAAAQAETTTPLGV